MTDFKYLVKTLEKDNENWRLQLTKKRKVYVSSEFEKSINKGKDINTKDCKNNTILHKYASFRDFSNRSINKILDFKPDVKIKNEKGKTALMIALRNCHELEIINRIIELKPNINERDKEDKTVLMYALETLKPEIYNRILELEPIITRETEEYANKFLNRKWITQEVYDRIMAK